MNEAPVFTNIYTSSEKDLANVIRAKLCRICVPFCLYLVVLLIGVSFLDSSIWMVVAGTLLVVVLIICVVPRLSAHRTLEWEKKLYGAPAQTKYEFYLDRILVHNLQTNTEQVIEYADLSKVKKTRTLYILVCKPNVMLPLDAACFTQGRREDFPAFIQEKCPQTKPERKGKRNLNG